MAAINQVRRAREKGNTAPPEGKPGSASNPINVGPPPKATPLKKKMSQKTKNLKVLLIQNLIHAKTLLHGVNGISNELKLLKKQVLNLKVLQSLLWIKKFLNVICMTFQIKKVDVLKLLQR
jgi:hypothetical protein